MLGGFGLGAFFRAPSPHHPRKRARRLVFEGGCLFFSNTTPPPPHRPRNRANVLVFEGGGLFTTTTTPPPSKLSERAHFRRWWLVYYHHHPTTSKPSKCARFRSDYLFTTTTTLETERVCSLSSGWLLSYHHHLTTLESECVRSFSKVVGLLSITTTPPSSKTSTHARFRWCWFALHCHLPTSSKTSIRARFRWCLVTFHWHHPTTRPPSKPSAYARFRVRSLVYHPTTIENERVCSFSMVIYFLNYCI